MFIKEDDLKLNEWQFSQRKFLPYEIKTKLAETRIREWYDNWNGQVYLSYSGGLDSTALLHMIRKTVGKEVPAVFSNTGLEFPEIVRFARKASGEFLEIYPQRKDGSRATFKWVVETYGFPITSKENAARIRKLRHGNLCNRYRNYLLNGDERGKFGVLPKKWHYLLETMFAYDVPSENSGKSYNANLISYEENQFQWAADSLVAGSIETVMQQENQVLFVQTGNVNVQVGDKITLSINNTKKTVTVAGILSDSPLARVKGTETFFCSEATFSALTGETGYTIIDIQFENNASSEDVNAIKNIFTNGGVIFSDSLSQVQQQRNLYYTFAVLVYGFLSIIVAITIFHIMNTINLGVAAKMKEYGSMRAIGMSNRQLIKMIIAEAGTYAISGVIWGCIIGLPMHWVIYVSLITNIWGTAWSVPFIPLILIIAIVLLTSLLAVKGPAKRLQRMSIVENISAQ